MNCNSVITYDMDCNTLIHNINYDENYAYVYVLQLNKSNEIISNVAIKEKEEDKIVFDIGIDGFYTLVTVKIPKDTTKEYYYSDGKVYHNNEQANLGLLLEMNPEVSGLIVDYEYYFQTCHLRKCYISVCQQIFDQVHSVDCNKQNLDQNLIFKRDLLFSALQIIDFMSEKGQYKEAELLLERIMNCNGLCDNHCNEKHKDSTRPCNCGCL